MLLPQLSPLLGTKMPLVHSKEIKISFSIKDDNKKAFRDHIIQLIISVLVLKLFTYPRVVHQYLFPNSKPLKQHQYVFQSPGDCQNGSNVLANFFYRLPFFLAHTYNVYWFFNKLYKKLKGIGSQTLFSKLSCFIFSMLS